MCNIYILIEVLPQAHTTFVSNLISIHWVSCCSVVRREFEKQIAKIDRPSNLFQAIGSLETTTYSKIRRYQWDWRPEITESKTTTIVLISTTKLRRYSHLVTQIACTIFSMCSETRDCLCIKIPSNHYRILFIKIRRLTYLYIGNHHTEKVFILTWSPDIIVENPPRVIIDYRNQIHCMLPRVTLHPVIWISSA